MPNTAPDAQPDPIPWYPNEEEQMEIIDQIWRDDTGALRRVDSIEPLGDPPVPVVRFRGLGYGMQWPIPESAGWTRVKPAPRPPIRRRMP